MLQAQGLAAQRGYTTLFEDLGFSVDRGEALVVSGTNGCGKTTLLRILAGLSAPSAGEIRWQDHPVQAFDPRLRDVVVFNGHLAALKDELTPEENLGAWTGLDARAADAAAITAALESVALSRQRQLPARLLSQGQRRRIGLARLAVSPRPLWILDEPLTALDADGAAVLGALLAAHLAAGGLVVAASHQLLPVPAPRVRSLQLGPRRRP